MELVEILLEQTMSHPKKVRGNFVCKNCGHHRIDHPKWGKCEAAECEREEHK